MWAYCRREAIPGTDTVEIPGGKLFFPPTSAPKSSPAR